MAYLLTFARVSPSISVNTTSGEICFTTSSHNQCSLANLTRYNVSIADVTGSLIFKSKAVAESSCVVVNFSNLLISQCGPFTISAQAYDDYVTYDSVHHIITPDNGDYYDLCSCLKKSIQLHIRIAPSYSSQTSMFTISYYCLTNYIIPPEIIFTDVNNRKLGKNKCFSNENLPLNVNTEAGYDYSLHLCGYCRSFVNQYAFIDCPINCVSLPTILIPHPMSVTGTAGSKTFSNKQQISIASIHVIVSEIPFSAMNVGVTDIIVITAVILIIQIPILLNRKKIKGTLSKFDSSDISIQKKRQNAFSQPIYWYMDTMPTMSYESITSEAVPDLDESLKYSLLSDTVANDKLHPLYHTILNCDHNGLEHTIAGHNITLRIPKGMVDAGDKIYFEVGVLLFGPFTFPGNTQPISPILWFCSSENDYQLKKPFKIILPHCLSSQVVEKMESDDIQFAKAKHELGQTTNYEFQFVDTKPLFASSGSRNFGVLQIQHCCFYCLVANRDVKGAEYCLVQIQRPLQSHRNEIHFLVIYFLDTCLRALEEQYPQKESYTISYYNTFQFKAEGEACLEMQVTTDHSDYIVGLMPNPPKIWRSDVDFWKKINDTNSVGTKMLMYQKHKRKMYPPRIITIVTAKTQGAVFKLQVKFKGCLRESQLDRDLSFPLDVSTAPTSSVGASTSSIGAESRDILSEKPSLPTAYRELLPLANCWKRIGAILGVPKSVLDRIRSDEEESSDRLLEMVSEWVKQVDPSPTWTALADAVEPFDKGKSADICRRIPHSHNQDFWHPQV